MDFLEFFAVVIPVLVTAVLISQWIRLADARARIELQKRLQKSKERTSAASRSRISPEEEMTALGEWVGPLLEEFGVDPDVLFDDEMPPELKTLLPLAKGFVNSGGLSKLLAGGGGNAEDGRVKI